MQSITIAILLTTGLALSAGQRWGGWNGGNMGGWNGGGGMGGWNGGGGMGMGGGWNGGQPPPPPPQGGGWGNGNGVGGGPGGWNAGGANVGDGNILNRDNFQASGCGWDFTQSRCRDLSLLTPTCRGGCKNFGNTIFSDCRCVPFNFFGKK